MLPKYSLESQLFDDRELWKKIANGNAEAFAAWYRETAPRLRVFLRHLLSSEPAAEDVMQETFTQIWRRPHGFDPDRGSPRAYLFGVAYSFVLTSAAFATPDGYPLVSCTVEFKTRE